MNFTVIGGSGGTGQTLADTSATEGTHYWYRVASLSYNFPGRLSAPSNTADCWSLPAAPSGLAVGEIDANRINLSWTNNSSGAIDFYIERLDPGTDSYAVIDDVTAMPDTNAYSDTSVQPDADGTDRTYSYLVLAATPDGDVSGTSNVVTADAERRHCESQRPRSGADGNRIDIYIGGRQRHGNGCLSLDGRHVSRAIVRHLVGREHNAVPRYGADGEHALLF